MNNHMKKLAFSCVALVLSPLAAAAQEACQTYQVQRGDTLREIAVAAYGTDAFRTIHNANREAIGPNPSLIEVGIVLNIPCSADGSVTAAPAEAVVEVAIEEEVGPFSLITGNDYPPFTDESLPGRGMFTQLVETAMLRADESREYDIKFVNDWAAHLDALLPSKAFDASFPWTRPNCEMREMLSDHDLDRCENYDYSLPFYEIVDGYYSRRGSGYDTAQTYDALYGASICRPEGYSMNHLDAEGLMEPTVELTRPVLIADCFEALMFGTVDIVAIDADVANDAIVALGIENEVAGNPNLHSVKPLSVIVHKSNPNGAEYLEILNRGLTEMRESGEWYAIVSTALQRQVEMRMN